MGLFNFIKEAGKSLFGGSADAAEADKVEKEIGDLGIDNSGLKVEVQGDKIVLTGEAKNQEELEKAILAAGNVEGVAQVESKVDVKAAGAESTMHTVAKGDTLWAIAQKHYGDGSKYPQIFEANKPMLSHPDKIYPGQVLRIPAK